MQGRQEVEEQEGGAALQVGWYAPRAGPVPKHP
jgi:hypothetical protein